MGDRFDWGPAPQTTQWREPNGRLDWRQWLDAITPGNWHNSNTNQLRPLGAVQGLTGVPIDTAVGLARRVPGVFRGTGSFLSSIGRGGRNLFGGREPQMPDFSSSFGRIGNDMANYRGGRNFTDMDNSRIAQEARNTVSNIEDFRRGGGDTRRERGESRIGLGQLGRGGDEAIAAANRAFWNRGGALLER